MENRSQTISEKKNEENITDSAYISINLYKSVSFYIIDS